MGSSGDGDLMLHQQPFDLINRSQSWFCLPFFDMNPIIQGNVRLLSSGTLAHTPQGGRKIIILDQNRKRPQVLAE